MKTSWKTLERQYGLYKETNMRRLSPEFAKTWKRRPEGQQQEGCKQIRGSDTEESKYFSITVEDSANTNGSDLDNTESLRKEVRKTESLTEEEQCELAL